MRTDAAMRLAHMARKKAYGEKIIPWTQARNTRANLDMRKEREREEHARDEFRHNVINRINSVIAQRRMENEMPEQGYVQ